MIIKEAEYSAGVMLMSQLPEPSLPEIALAGRSNVGKSSLINRMLSRKSIARTSSTPGKTRMLNYYRINGDLYFVDCPGYGYAQVSQTQRRHWGSLVETYLLERPTLKLILLLIDVRHPPTKDDKAMHEWLRHHQLPVCVVATKADKISRSKLPSHVSVIRKELDMDKEAPLIPFSSETGQGRDELWQMIQNFVGRPADVHV